MAMNHIAGQTCFATSIATRQNSAYRSGCPDNLRCCRHTIRRDRNTPDHPQSSSARHSIACHWQSPENVAASRPLESSGSASPLQWLSYAVPRQHHGHLVALRYNAFGSASTTSARPPVFETAADTNMKFLFVSLPFSKTGGLADVVEALPKALVAQATRWPWCCRGTA